MYRTLQVTLFQSAFLLRRLHTQLFPVVPHCSGTGPERFPGRVCSYGATFWPEAQCARRGKQALPLQLVTACSSLDYICNPGHVERSSPSGYLISRQ